MKTFWLTARLGGADIRTMLKSDAVDVLVADWEVAAKKVDAEDVGGASREFIIENMLKNRHHTDKEIGRAVCSALLWLVVKGPLGEKLLPFMRQGGPNMVVNVEITKVDEDRPLYNFRTTVDDKTSAQMSL
jgi:hypothetical protein